jgi:hypothetical protein
MSRPDKDRNEIIADIQGQSKSLTGAGRDGKIIMSGSNICVRETLEKFGMIEEYKNYKYITKLDGKAKRKMNAKNADTEQINLAKAAKGEEPMKLGKDGRRLGVSEAARSAGIDSTGTRNIAKGNEGTQRALDLVNEALNRAKRPRLTLGKDGQALGLLDAAKSLFLVNSDPYLIQLSLRADKAVTAYNLVNDKLIEENEPQLELGGDGRALGLLEAAKRHGLVNRDPYLIQLSLKADNAVNAYNLVKEALFAAKEPPLEIGRAGQVIGLLDAAKRHGLVNRDPYLIFHSLQADKAVNAYKLVKDKLKAENEPRLEIGRAGQVIGLLDAAKHHGLVNRDPYLIQLSLQADGVVDAYNLVKEALSAAKEPPLEIGREGQVIGLLEAAKRLKLVGNAPYLVQLDHAAHDINTAHNFVNGVLSEAGEEQLHRGVHGGPVQGLLEAATRHNLWNKNAYLKRLYMASTLTALAANTRYDEAAALFASEGLDPVLDLAAKNLIVKNIFDKYLPTLRNRRQSQPFFQIFVACKGRADTNQGDEVVAQLNYDHFKARWTTSVHPFEAVKEFEFFELFKTNNPPNSFLIEKALHQEAVTCGSIHPTERLFSRIGAGGFNPAHHYPGKTYGVYLLVRYSGPPSSWTLVVDGKRSRDNNTE